VVIPRPVLDAIDPPDVPKTKKKAQKEKQKEARKGDKRKQAAIDKLAISRFRKAEKRWRSDLTRNLKRQTGRKPDEHYWDLPEQTKARNAIWVKSKAEAPREYEQKLSERALAKKNKPKKPPKKKPIKITDIIGTLFDVDVDGSGVRPVIPAIHPAALLRGGGATIGGSHTPDMAYVNLIYDAAKIDALSKGKDVRLKYNFAYEVVDAEKGERLFIEAMQEALETGAFSLDLETYVDDPDRHHALMAYVAKIRVIGIATDKRAVSVAWEFLGPLALSYFQLVLMSVASRYHNGLYDRTVLRAYGFIIPIEGLDEDAPRFDDTLLAHHAAFPGNAHKLQTVGAQFFGVPAWKSEFRNQEEMPENLAIYNARDTGVTHALMPALDVWIQRTRTERVYEIDRHMSDVASQMHLNGMPVSREVNTQLVTTFTRLSREAKKKIEAQAADPKTLDRIKHKLALLLASKKRKRDDHELQLVYDGPCPKEQEFEELYRIRKRDLDDERWYWKINNSKHIAAFLQALDVSLTQTTEQGQISTKKEVLESLVDVPVVRDILEYRENEKMLDFVGPIFDRLDGQGNIQSYGFADENCRIHPIWSIHKISGRWAGSEPMGVSNPPREKTKKVPFGMNLPPDIIITNFICECGAYESGKHDGHTYKPKLIEYAVRPTTKRQIVAPPGRIFVGFDFSQLEARIIALISGDEFMCDVFARDGDLHTECAIEVFPGFKDKTASERKMMRTVCKTLEYATWYGAADEKVWKGLLKEGYTYRLQDVVGALNRLRRKMIGVVGWQRETIGRASQPPFELRDFVLDRRRVWPMGQVEASEALNIVPQATGASIMDLGMWKMTLRLPKYKEAYPIVQVHDASVFELWEDDAEPFQKDVDECFEFECTNPKNGKTVRFPIESEIGTTWALV
jgi:DNA polymerase I-like protein with 3'-5' exonuclease and polymerase domains